MAIQKLEKDKFGQIELNHVAWRRDGRIHAQSYLDEVEFANKKPAENGIVLRIDPVSRKLKFPQDGDVNPIYGINYSTELIYDERTRGLKNFYLTTDDVLPRLGLPAVGDIFTTNTVAYDDGDFSDIVTALENIDTAPIFGEVKTGTEGYICLTSSPTTPANKFKVLVKEKTTMPDGQLAVKLQVISV